VSEHLCNYKGFGLALGDVCPACEKEQTADPTCLALLPCPFCGNEYPNIVQWLEGDKPNWRVVCLPCLHSNRDSEAEAQSAWNRRVREGPTSVSRTPAQANVTDLASSDRRPASDSSAPNGQGPERLPRWRKHNWRSRTVRVLDLGITVPCECAWWKRLWYLATEWL
jgi:hypothetical protein